VDEEVVLLEEQLAAAQADIEQLQNRLAEAEAQAGRRAEESAELRRRLAERDSEVTQRTGEIERLQGVVDATLAQEREAVQRYRDAVLAREPELPADLIAGDSIAAIDAALSRARETVAQVRQHIEDQAQSLRVPSGAPPRGAPDLSDLTAAEKIRLGLSKNG
jgi:chromosome segregation ATPase